MNKSEKLREAIGELDFKIGDRVCLRSTLEQWKLEMELNKRHTYERFGVVPWNTIVGILIDVCYGGTQVHYLVRGYDPKGSSAVLKLLGCELATADEAEKAVRDFAEEQRAAK